MQRRVTRLLPDVLSRHGACGVVSEAEQPLRILLPLLPGPEICSPLELQQRDLLQGPSAGLVMGQPCPAPDVQCFLPRPRRAWANLNQATSTAMHGYYMAHQRAPCTLGTGTCSFATVSSETAAKSGARARSESTSQQTPATPAAKDQDMPTLTADMRFRPSRFHRLQNEVLHREMQLKLGDVHHWNATPRVHAVELSIMAAGDTRLSSEDVQRSDLLLYRLALEHMAGGERAVYVPAKTRRTPVTASGVRVRLKGKAALDFLEKLIYVVLPNQISFEGIGHAERVLPLGTKRRLHWNPQNQPPEDLYSLKLKVDNLLLYPDFNYNFELFEPLRSMRVNILVSDAQSEAMARLYVSGFGLPLMKEAVVEE